MMQIPSTNQQGFADGPFDYVRGGQTPASSTDDAGPARGVAFSIVASGLVYALIATLLYHIF